MLVALAPILTCIRLMGLQTSMQLEQLLSMVHTHIRFKFALSIWQHLWCCTLFFLFFWMIGVKRFVYVSAADFGLANYLVRGYYEGKVCYLWVYLYFIRTWIFTFQCLRTLLINVWHLFMIFSQHFLCFFLLLFFGSRVFLLVWRECSFQSKGAYNM